MVVAFVATVAAGAVWLFLLSPQTGAVFAGQRVRAVTLDLICSPNPEDRKIGAWRVILDPDPRAEDLLRRALFGDEPSEDVREACVYSLGRIGDRNNTAAVEHAIDLDPSGYVRCAAWLAAARLDPDHFRTLAATATPLTASRPTTTPADPPTDPWDAIGIAQGRLVVGDASGVSDLLHWARAGDVAQRHIASKALTRRLVPLLDSVGRWPVDVTPGVDETWPPELIDDIAKRCEDLDLQPIATQLRSAGQRTAQFRSDLRRITSTRDRLVHLLFGE